MVNMINMKVLYKTNFNEKKDQFDLSKSVLYELLRGRQRFMDFLYEYNCGHFHVSGGRISYFHYQGS